MKIALIGSIISPTAPSGKGGTSVFNYTLTSELRRIIAPNDKLVIFASKNSKIKPKFYPICKESTLEGDSKTVLKESAAENASFFKAMQYIKKNGFDVVHHSHFNFLPVALSVSMGLKTLLTVHVNRDIDFIDNLKVALGEDLKKILFVSISLSHRKVHSDINFFTNIYNGVNLKMFKYDYSSNKKYFCWLGRIIPYKGLKEAAEIAMRTKTKLKFAGPIQDKDYFLEIKKKYPTKLVEYIGVANAKKRQNLLEGAKAFLFPLKWEEPFGLVIAEAMACGTPIVAFKRGAVEEIVQDNKTGFICPADNLSSLTEAAKKIINMPDIDYVTMRKNCRQRVENDFSAHQMAQNYYALYKDILD